MLAACEVMTITAVLRILPVQVLNVVSWSAVDLLAM